MTAHTKDIIRLDQASTLAAAFTERVRRSPEQVAYLQYDRETEEWQRITWRQASADAACWQEALRRERLAPGDRVALMMSNRKEWALFDLAAQGLGLVTVPLYTNDRAENIRHVLTDSGTRLLLLENEDQWRALEPIAEYLVGIQRILSLHPVTHNLHQEGRELRPLPTALWLPKQAPEYEVRPVAPDELATIVYTSGTTGAPKGVMLSHRNILWNIDAVLQCIDVFQDDLFLSFLPLSHTLERTVGYYLPLVAGASVAYARSIPELAADLQTLRPTVLISVPRIFERVYARLQDKLAADPAPVQALFRLAQAVGLRHFLHAQSRTGWSFPLLFWPILDHLVGRKVRARLGGRLRVAVSGGAPLSPEISELFLGLGVTLIQGYGLTEASPVVSANTLEDNIPASIGRPLPGVEVRVGASDELLVRCPSVMLGYWNLPEATAEAIDSEGWLHTGDQTKIEEDGHIYLTGRLKEIIVLANGEKVSPSDMETAIALDGLINQVMIVGEGRPYLAALITLEPEAYARLASEEAGLTGDLSRDRHSDRLQEILLARVAERLTGFPGYAKILRIAVMEKPWRIENGVMTPTMKIKRTQILETCGKEIGALFEDHR